MARIEADAAAGHPVAKRELEALHREAPSFDRTAALVFDIYTELLNDRALTVNPMSGEGIHSAIPSDSITSYCTQLGFDHFDTESIRKMIRRIERDIWKAEQDDKAKAETRAK
jgi:hypothetical protein